MERKPVLGALAKMALSHNNSQAFPGFSAQGRVEGGGVEVVKGPCWIFFVLSSYISAHKCVREERVE